MPPTRLRRALVSRSRFLVLAAIGLTAVVATRAIVSAGAPATPPADWTNDLSPIAAADWNYDRAAHLLERARLRRHA